MKLNKLELIDALHERCNIYKYQAEEYLDAFADIISEALAEGDKVKIKGLGTFYTTLVKEHEINDPNRDDIIVVPSSIRVIFRASKELKKRLKEKAIEKHHAGASR